MSSILIRKALEIAVNGISPAVSTQWENTTFKPVDGTPYQRVSIYFGSPENPSVGDGLHREHGWLQIDLMYPPQVGTSVANTRAELIRTTFARGTSFVNGGQTVTIERTPSINPGYRDGGRWKVVVKAIFWADIFT